MKSYSTAILDLWNWPYRVATFYVPVYVHYYILLLMSSVLTFWSTWIRLSWCLDKKNKTCTPAKHFWAQSSFYALCICIIASVFMQLCHNWNISYFMYCIIQCFKEDVLWNQIEQETLQQCIESFNLSWLPYAWTWSFSNSQLSCRSSAHSNEKWLG